MCSLILLVSQQLEQVLSLKLLPVCGSHSPNRLPDWPQWERMRLALQRLGVLGCGDTQVGLHLLIGEGEWEGLCEGEKGG